MLQLWPKLVKSVCYNRELVQAKVCRPFVLCGGARCILRFCCTLTSLPPTRVRLKRFILTTAAGWLAAVEEERWCLPCRVSRRS
jgi:hypothetical protein